MPRVTPIPLYYAFPTFLSCFGALRFSGSGAKHGLYQFSSLLVTFTRFSFLRGFFFLHYIINFYKARFILIHTFSIRKYLSQYILNQFSFINISFFTSASNETCNEIRDYINFSLSALLHVANIRLDSREEQTCYEFKRNTRDFDRRESEQFSST